MDTTNLITPETIEMLKPFLAVFGIPITQIIATLFGVKYVTAFAKEHFGVKGKMIYVCTFTLGALGAAATADWSQIPKAAIAVIGSGLFAMILVGGMYDVKVDTIKKGNTQ